MLQILEKTEILQLLAYGIYWYPKAILFTTCVKNLVFFLV